MRYVETCPCGSKLEAENKGWGVMDISGVLAEWRALHRPHIREAHAPQRKPPTKAQLDALVDRSLAARPKR